MDVEYIYCPSCGYEDCDCYVEYSATYANGDFFICPWCHEETSHVDVGTE